jgi:hypothetical protein
MGHWASSSRIFISESAETHGARGGGLGALDGLEPASTGQDAHNDSQQLDMWPHQIDCLRTKRAISL